MEKKYDINDTFFLCINLPATSTKSIFFWIAGFEKNLYHQLSIIIIIINESKEIDRQAVKKKNSKIFSHNFTARLQDRQTAANFDGIAVQ